MQVVRHRRFVKQAKKLPIALRLKARERVELLMRDARHPLLNDHPLHSPYDGCRSINITGDYRVVYRKITPDIIELRAIGTHPELYGD